MVIKRVVATLVLAGAVVIAPLQLQAVEEQSVLRQRLKVLDQARQKAAMELAALQDKGKATAETVKHYATVAEFLDKEIRQTCSHLMGTGSSSVPQCPDFPVIQRKPKAVEPLPAAPVQPETRSPAASVVQDEESQIPVPAVQEKLPQTGKDVQKKDVPSGPSRETGFFTSIIEWFKQLFQVHPPSTPQSSSEQQASQKSNSSETTQAKQTSETTQQQEQKSGRGNTNPLNSKTSASTGTEERPAARESGGVNESSKANSAVSASQEKSNRAGSEQTDVSSRKTALPTGSAEQQSVKKDKKVFDSKGNLATESRDFTTGQLAEKNGRTRSLHSTGTELKGKKKQSRKVSGNGQQLNNTSATAESGRSGKILQRSADGIQRQAKGMSSGGGSQSHPSEIRKLEQSLSEALDNFDGAMLSEQERLSSRIPKQREGGGYGAVGTDEGMGGLSGSGQEVAESDPSDSESGTSGTSSTGQGPAGSSGMSGSGRTTIGADDDIVARQLREAAEQETDPVLKEKLWKEYRNYKAGK